MVSKRDFDKVTWTCMHCKGFLEMCIMFIEVPTSLIPFLFSGVMCVYLSVVQGKIILSGVRKVCLIFRLFFFIF